MCTLHDFLSIKLDLHVFIRALLLDWIFALEKTTRTPGVHLVISIFVTEKIPYVVIAMSVGPFVCLWSVEIMRLHHIYHVDCFGLNINIGVMNVFKTFGFKIQIASCNLCN